MEKSELLGKLVVIKQSGAFGHIVAYDDSELYPFYINAPRRKGEEISCKLSNFSNIGLDLCYADGYPMDTLINVFEFDEFELAGSYSTVNQIKQKVYYAHFMGIYNKPIESRDIEALKVMGYDVVNPNNPEIQEMFKNALSTREDQGHKDAYLRAFDDVFGQFVRNCDILAFRPLPNGQITGGVALEIQEALNNGKIVFEIPNESSLRGRYMTGPETRAYMVDMGMR